MVRMIDLLMQLLLPGAKVVTKRTLHQSKAKKLVGKVVAPAPASASPGSFSLCHRSRSRTHGKAVSHRHRCWHEDFSRMAERTAATERAVAGQRWQTQGDVTSASVATGFSGQQGLKQKARAAAVRRAGVQAVEACSTGKAATIQNGTACEDRLVGLRAINLVADASPYPIASIALRAKHQLFRCISRPFCTK